MTLNAQFNFVCFEDGTIDVHMLWLSDMTIPRVTE